MLMETEGAKRVAPGVGYAAYLMDLVLGGAGAEWTWTWTWADRRTGMALGNGDGDGDGDGVCMYM